MYFSHLGVFWSLAFLSGKSFCNTDGFSLSRIVFDFSNLDVSARITHAIIMKNEKLFFFIFSSACPDDGMVSPCRKVEITEIKND